jgi:hypothetical protein
MLTKPIELNPSYTAVNVNAEKSKQIAMAFGQSVLINMLMQKRA